VGIIPENRNRKTFFYRRGTQRKGMARTIRSKALLLVQNQRKK
jgi:hypothetical protein